MAKRGFIVVPDAIGCILLCLDASIWPALSGLISDYMWTMEDEETRDVMERILIMVDDCCEVFEACGLVTKDWMEENFLDILGRLHFLPPEVPYEEGGPLRWPAPGTATEDECCNMAYALYQAWAHLYTTAYDLANTGTSYFVNWAIPFLSAAPLAFFFGLILELAASGVQELLLANIEANRFETICTILQYCDNGGTDADIAAMRDAIGTAFQTFAPVPLDILVGMIVPLAKRMYELGVDCDCAQWIVSRPVGAGTEQPYEHPWFVYQAGHRYCVYHIEGECIYRPGTGMYRSAAHCGVPPTDLIANFQRGGTYSTYPSCEAVGEDGDFWACFDVLEDTNLMQHADDPNVYQTDIKSLRIVDQGIT